MDLPCQEGPSTSRDPVPVTYQLKVSEGPVQAGREGLTVSNK